MPISFLSESEPLPLPPCIPGKRAHDSQPCEGPARHIWSCSILSPRAGDARRISSPHPAGRRMRQTLLGRATSSHPSGDAAQGKTLSAWRINSPQRGHDARQDAPRRIAGLARDRRWRTWRCLRERAPLLNRGRPAPGRRREPRLYPASPLTVSSVFNTRSSCSAGLTLRRTSATTPLGSTTNVVRSAPQYMRPYIDF